MTSITVPARNGTQPQPAAPDPELAAILGPPPILASEDAGAYAALQERVRATVVPADIIEELWVRDVVDLIWEVLRLRRLRAKLLTTERRDALHTVLSGLMDRDRREDTIPRWAKGMRQAKKDVDRALTGAGLDEAAVDAVALSRRLETFERIERMIMQAEVRRNAVLREVDRHRATLGQQLRSLAEESEALAAERPALPAERPAVAAERLAIAVERPPSRSPTLGWDHGDGD